MSNVIIKHLYKTLEEEKPVLQFKMEVKVFASL